MRRPGGSLPKKFKKFENGSWLPHLPLCWPPSLPVASFSLSASVFTTLSSCPPLVSPPSLLVGPYVSISLARSLVVSLRPCLCPSLSPVLLVSLSPCLPVFASVFPSLPPCLWPPTPRASFSSAPPPPFLGVSLPPCLCPSLSPVFLVSLSPFLPFYASDLPPPVQTKLDQYWTWDKMR